MAANLYMNWSDVGVTPAGGSLVTIEGVTDIRVNKMSAQEFFYGDALHFAAEIRNAAGMRSLEIMTGDVGKLFALDTTKEFTVTAKLNHSINGELVGCLTFTLVKAKTPGVSGSGTNNKYAGSSISFNARGDTSDADPLTIAIAV